METLQAESPLLAASDPPTSFIGLTAARKSLPRLRAAQEAARQAIAQHIAERRGAAAHHFMHRLGPGAVRAGVRHAPSSIARPPSASPGAGGPPSHLGPPLPHPHAPAAPPTPAARLLMRRPPMAQPPVHARPYLPFAPARPHLHPIPVPGTVLRRCMNTMAGGGSTPEEPPNEEPTEQELTATNEEMRQKETEIRQEIVKVMQANLEDIDRIKVAEGPAAGEPRIALVAMDALTHMTGGRPGTKEVILQEVEETLTGRVLLPRCLLRQTRILGVGGMGVVVEAEVVDTACQRTLRMETVALKLMYQDVSGIDISRVSSEALLQRYRGMVESELHPLKLIQEAVGSGQSAQQLARESNWAIPSFSATAGNPEEVYVHNGFLLPRRVLLSEMMLGDALTLLHMHDGSPGARLPMQAREYVCQQLLTSVAALHNIGLVHYDIKPENILIGRDGKVHLADFGLCGKADQPASCSEGLTPLYADPLQADCLQRRGRLSKSARYDSWSAGDTCYLLITSAGFPYKIPNDPSVLRHLSSLNWKFALRPSVGIGDPKKELLKAGASPLWASIVGKLLIIPRCERPTPAELLKRYHIGKFGQD
ncbi:hypothetical protein ACSSS7_004204 [Eimeria intestinalis]